MGNFSNSLLLKHEKFLIHFGAFYKQHSRGGKTKRLFLFSLAMSDCHADLRNTKKAARLRAALVIAFGTGIRTKNLSSANRPLS